MTFEQNKCYRNILIDIYHVFLYIFLKTAYPTLNTDEYPTAIVLKRTRHHFLYTLISIYLMLFNTIIAGGYSSVLTVIAKQRQQMTQILPTLVNHE